MTSNNDTSSIEINALHKTEITKNEKITLEDKYSDILKKIIKRRDTFVRDFFHNNVSSDLTNFTENLNPQQGFVKKPQYIGEFGDLPTTQQYANNTNGDCLVPFGTLNNCPKEIQFATGTVNNTNGWMALNAGDQKYQSWFRKYVINACNLDRGYTLAPAAAKVLDVLKTNSSLDDLGNAFGRQSLSVWSSDTALAFNNVNSQFSTCTLFLKALNYLMSGSLRQNTQHRSQSLWTDSFPGVKRITTRTTALVAGIVQTGTNDPLFGHMSDAWKPYFCYCTQGQYISMKRGTLDAPAGSFVRDCLSNPDNWTFVPIRGDRIGSDYNMLQQTPMTYIASFMQFPISSGIYTTRYANDFITGSADAANKLIDLSDCYIGSNVWIPGAKNVCFVIMNNLNQNQNQAMEVNVQGNDIETPHWSTALAFPTNADINIMRAAVYLPGDGLNAIQMLLDTFGSSEGLELALKILPTQYAFAQPQIIDKLGQMYWMTNGAVNSADFGEALDTFSGTCHDPFGKPWTRQSYFNYTTETQGTANIYGNILAGNAYRLPTCTSTQHMALACRHFENLTSYEYNELLPTSSKYSETWFYGVDSAQLCEYLYMYIQDIACACGALTSLVGRSIPISMDQVFSPVDRQGDTMALGLTEMLADAFAYKGFNVKEKHFNATNVIYDGPIWSNANYRDDLPAWNVGITNLFGKQYGLDWDTVIYDKVRESANKAVRDYATSVSYRFCSDNMKVSKFNMVSAVRFGVKKMITYATATERANWYTNTAEFTPYSPFDQWDIMNVTSRMKNQNHYYPMRLAYQLQPTHLEKTTKYTDYTSTDEYAIELIMPFANNWAISVYGEDPDFYIGFKDNMTRPTFCIELSEARGFENSITYATEYANTMTTLNELRDSFREMF